MKKVLAFLLIIVMSFASTITVNAINETNNTAEMYKIKCEDLNVECKSAILIEAETGEVLYCKNEEEINPLRIFR